MQSKIIIEKDLLRVCTPVTAVLERSGKNPRPEASLSYTDCSYTERPCLKHIFLLLGVATRNHNPSTQKSKAEVCLKAQVPPQKKK